MGESNTIVSAYTLCRTYNSIVSPMYNSKLKESVDDKLDVAKKMDLSLTETKTLWEKEKMLVTSIFSFSHNVFKGFHP